MIELVMTLLLFCGFLMICEKSRVRKVFGLILMSTALNLFILICGGYQKTAPAFLNIMTTGDFANPLPQALILTAVVISFSLLAWLCMLLRMCQKQKR